jgi:hypothetical protein
MTELENVKLEKIAKFSRDMAKEGLSVKDNKLEEAYREVVKMAIEKGRKELDEFLLKSGFFSIDAIREEVGGYPAERLEKYFLYKYLWAYINGSPSIFLRDLNSQEMLIEDLKNYGFFYVESIKFHQLKMNYPSFINKVKAILSDKGWLRTPKRKRVLSKKDFNTLILVYAYHRANEDKYSDKDSYGYFGGKKIDTVDNLNFVGFGNLFIHLINLRRQDEYYKTYFGNSLYGYRVIYQPLNNKKVDIFLKEVHIEGLKKLWEEFSESLFEDIDLIKRNLSQEHSEIFLDKEAFKKDLFIWMEKATQ